MSEKTATEIRFQQELARVRELARRAEDFERWWYDEGSGMIPQPDEDHDEHVHRICRIAWTNGAFNALN